MATFDLGIVYEPYPEDLRELSDALSKLTGTTPHKERVFAYAGPNDVVQILIDATNWKDILTGLALVFGASFASEIGKLAASDVWKNKENYYEAVKRASAATFLRTVAAIKALRAKGQIVSIAVKIPDSRRNAGLVITSDDPAEIAWQMANVTRCSEEIYKVIEETSRSSDITEGDNPDMSLVIEVLESGDVRILGTIVKT